MEHNTVSTSDTDMQLGASSAWTYSYSQIRQALDCPRQWAYSYVAGYRPPPNVYMVGGKGVDTALNQLVKDPNVSTAQDVLRETIFAEADKIPTKAWEEEETTPEEVVTGGSRLLAIYANKYLPHVIVQNSQLQVEPYIAGRKFLGYVDLVRAAPGDGHSIIADHKFVSKAPSQGTVAKSLQLRTYDFAIDDPSHHVELVNLVNRKREPDVIVTSHFVTADDRADMVRTYTWIIRQLERREYPMTNPANFMVCGTRCPHWFRCRGRAGGPEPIPGEVGFPE